MPRPTTAIATILFVLLICGTAAAEERKLGRALVTYYWVADESSDRYDGERSSVLRDVRGRVIAQTTHRFKIDLIRQGSGWLRDGRTVIYMKKVGDESRFKVVSSKFGLGSTGCPLIPYRTIAVDPNFVKLGTRVYIARFNGATLPDGTVHDGMFVASDRGHFRGAHIDFFVGAGAKDARPFTRKAASLSRVTAYSAGRTGGCRP